MKREWCGVHRKDKSGEQGRHPCEQELEKAWEIVECNKRKARKQVLALEREAGCWPHHLGTESWILPNGKRKDWLLTCFYLASLSFFLSLLSSFPLPLSFLLLVFCKSHVDMPGVNFNI